MKFNDYYKGKRVEKEQIGKLTDGTTIYEVDGEYIRDNIDIEFTEGGHSFVYEWIPEDEIWVEKMKSKNDQREILSHEITEYTLMKYGKKEYDEAHGYASSAEAILRKFDTVKEIENELQ
jgi:hypothetical protein